MNVFIKFKFHSASNKGIYIKKIKINAVVQKYNVVVNISELWSLKQSDYFLFMTFVLLSSRDGGTEGARGPRYWENS